MPAPRRSPESKQKRLIAVRRQLEKNSGKQCVCKGCHEDRYRLHPYCEKHSRRYSRQGSPDGRIPTAKELTKLDQIIVEWLDEQLNTPAIRKAFKLNWGSAQSSLFRPRSEVKDYSFFQGFTGLTRDEKSNILMAGYQHKRQLSYSLAMVRWMSARLAAELIFEFPRGKRDFTKEKRKYYNHIAGTFIVRRCGITKVQDRAVIVGWEKSIFAPLVGQPKPMLPITERQVKYLNLSPAKTPMLTRVIGWRLEQAVEQAMGNRWLSDYDLLARAHDVLGVTQNNPSQPIQNTKKENQQ